MTNDERALDKAIQRARDYKTVYSEDSQLEEVLKDPLRFSQDYSKRLYLLMKEKHFRDGFLSGLKENNPEWHNLEENPKDLPTKSGRYLCYFGGEDTEFIMDFEEESNAFGYWCGKYDAGSLGFIDSEFETIEDRGEDKVVAWCEIPRYRR